MKLQSKVEVATLVLASVGLVVLVYTLAPIIKILLSAVFVGFSVYYLWKFVKYIKQTYFVPVLNC